MYYVVRSQSPIGLRLFGFSSSACSFFCFFGLKRERFLLQVGYLAGFVGSIALDCVGLARWLKSLFITPTFSWNIVTA